MSKDKMLTLIGAQALAFLVPIVTFSIYIISSSKMMKRKQKVIIGFVEKLPQPCAEWLPVFHSVKSAVNSGYHVCIVHFSRLSKALRRADLVFYEEGSDEKIFPPDHDIWKQIGKSAPNDELQFSNNTSFGNALTTLINSFKNK